jgi:hypothetical protein
MTQIALQLSSIRNPKSQISNLSAVRWRLPAADTLSLLQPDYFLMISLHQFF